MKFPRSALAAAVAVLPIVMGADCPAMGEPPRGHPIVRVLPHPTPGYDAAVKALDIDAVKADIRYVLTDSKPWWPADYGNYGPMMIRLAWHCAGSYRLSDGVGGCDGGRIRFDYERSWDDNTNLDKARRILWPVKQKYGLGLSWGDLIILTGNTAIEMMGGPVLGTCMGRVDEVDGAWSEALGPSELQQEVAPCGDLEGDDGGDCQGPFGATTLRLIYVNPGGPFGNFTDLAGSAEQSRSSFGRMAMNDTETVALIGGGHAFGKCHGMCPEGSGPPPKEQPWDPWPGNCGVDSPHTSGFEGPWTETPDQWSNLYFQYLQTLADQYEAVVGPSGNVVWNLKDREMKMAPGTRDPDAKVPVMMLSSDLALLHDPKGEYQKVVKEFAEDIKSLEHHFAHSWYKLTTRDMGPISRCVGDHTAPVQPWQFPLPEPPANATDFAVVKRALAGVMTGNMYKFVRLALRCASTYRATDYRGGCNGARIRFAPESEWPINKGLDEVLATLEPVKSQFPDLSWSDLIVFAGTAALELKGAPEMPFCPGRTDASDGEGSENLEPWATGAFDDSLADFKHSMKITGLSLRESIALMGLSAIGDMHPSLRTYMHPADPKSANITSKFYDHILGEDWREFTMPSGEKQFKASGKNIYALKTEAMLGWDAELLAVAQEYAVDEAAFKAELATAWTKLMTADRFDGPTGNVCDEINAKLSAAPVCEEELSHLYKDIPNSNDAGVIAAAVVGALIGAALFIVAAVMYFKKKAAAAASGKVLVEADVGMPVEATN